MFLILRTASSTSPLRQDGLPRRSLGSLLAMTKCVVIASPLPAWRSTVNQKANRILQTPPPRHDGLPRRSLVLPPRNDKMRNFQDDLLPGGIR